MIQTLLRHCSTLVGATNIALYQTVTHTTSDGLNYMIASTDGVASNLHITRTTAPGGGASSIFEIFKNGAATGVTVTIGPSGTTGADTTNTVSYVAGDRLHLEHTTSGGTPASCELDFSLDLDSDDTVSSWYGINVGVPSLDFADIFGSEQSNTRSNCDRPIAYDGTITEMHVGSNTFAIGAGTALDVYLYLNGVKQDGSGGTVDTQTTIGPSAAGTNVSQSFSLPVARGDYICIGLERTGIPNSWISISIRFEAAVAGVHLIAARGGGDPSSGVANDHSLIGGGGGTVWVGTGGASANLTSGVTPVGMSLLFVECSVDPGSGNTRTFEVFKNGSAPSSGPAGVVSFGSLVIDDTTGFVDFSEDDDLTLRHTPASTPTVTGIEYWGIVLYDVTGPPPPPPTRPTGGGDVDDDVVLPASATLASTILRTFVRITYGAGSPYSSFSIAETDLHEPSGWAYGAPIYGVLTSVSEITRELSETIRGIEVRVGVADDATLPDSFREIAANDGFSGGLLEVFVVEDAVRYADGEPYRLFAGIIQDHTASDGFNYDLVARDVLSEEIARLDEAPRIPSKRLSTTEFPDMTKEYEGRVAPILIGQLNDTDETGTISQPAQGVVRPVILGRINLQTAFGGVNEDVYGAILTQGALVTNGAWEWFYNPLDTPDQRIPVPSTVWGVNAWSPGFPGWASTGITNDYLDYPASPAAETRRYTLIFVQATGGVYSDAFRDGSVIVAANVYGIAENDDGSGRYIDDAPRAWQWLIVNCLYNEFKTTYAAVPTFAGGYSIINVASVAAATTTLRGFGGGQISDYPVGFMLGRDGQQQTLRHILEELCRGVLMEQGVDRHGRLMVSVEDPDEAATVTLTALSDIENGRFETWIDRASYRNNAELLFGFRYTAPSAPVKTPNPGEAQPDRPVQPFIQWTSGLRKEPHTAAIAANGGVAKTIRLENFVVRQYATAQNVAQRLLHRLTGASPGYNGPRMFRLTTSWQGLFNNGVEVELGTVIAMTHLDGVGASGWTNRRGRVLKISVDPLNARVTLEGRVLYSVGDGELDP